MNARWGCCNGPLSKCVLRITECADYFRRALLYKDKTDLEFCLFLPADAVESPRQLVFTAENDGVGVVAAGKRHPQCAVAQDVSPFPR